MSPRIRSIIIFLFLLYSFWLLLNAYLTLAPDEAHYWYWSKYPALSFYDHPPMVAYVMAVSTWVGGDSEFFVRLGGLLCMVVGQVFLFLTAGQLCRDDKSVPWEIIFVLNLTLLTAAGVVVQTPDSPLMLFWMLALYCGSRIVTGGGARWWYLFGLALGLGLLSKYTMILAVPGMFGFVLLSKEHRHWLLKKDPYLSMLLALLVFSPVIVWNQQHHWISFGFQMRHGFVSEGGSRLAMLGEYLAGQVGVITPGLLLAFAIYAGWGTYQAFKANRSDYLYLALMSWPVLLFFAVSTIKGQVAAPNWPAPAYAAGFVLMWIVYRRHFAQRRGHRIFVAAAIGLALVIFLVVHSHLVHPWVPVKAQDDPTRQFHGWRELGQTLREVMQQHPAEKGYFIVADRNLTTVAPAVYYTDKTLLGVDFLTPEQHTFLPEIDRLKGKDAIILLNNHSEWQLARHARYFEEVEEIGMYGYLFRGQPHPRFDLRMILGKRYLGNWHPSTAPGD
jgi:4-amino-4-deoxy-L-arabinose transferase-like glycosyltransferase